MSDVATLKMADRENMEVDKGENKPCLKQVKSVFDDNTQSSDKQTRPEGKTGSAESRSTVEYCEKLQTWMWQYYTGYVNWQSWLAASTMSCSYYVQPPSGTSTAADFSPHSLHNNVPFGFPLSPYPPAVNSPSGRVGDAAVGAAAAAQQQQLQPQANGNAQRPGNDCCSLKNTL